VKLMAPVGRSSLVTRSAIGEIVGGPFTTSTKDIVLEAVPSLAPGWQLLFP